MSVTTRGAASRFHSDGYVVVPGLLSGDIVAGVGAFLEEAVDVSLEQLGAEFGVTNRDELIKQVYLKLQGGGSTLPQHILHIAMGHFALATRLSERLWEIAVQPALLELLGELIDTQELYMHLPPTARFVLPGNSFAGVPAHQDIRYNGHLPPGFATVWVPFVKIDEACGGVIVYDGMRDAIFPLQTANGPWLGAIDVTGFPKKHIQIAPGDVLILDERIVHASAPNLSERVRISVDFRFFSGCSGKPALDLRRRCVIQPKETI